MSPVRTLLICMLTSGLMACGAQQRNMMPGFYQVETTKPYGDVLAELEVAITEQNFRITGHNHIGSVIRTRDNISFPDYDAIQFCSLTLARQMLEMSPAAVAYMPCNISVRSAGATVVIATHLLPEDSGNAKLDTFFRTMNEKLRNIVNFAADQ